MIDVAEPTGHLPPAEGLAAAEPSAHAIIDLTPTGIVSSWNPGAALLFGYPEVEMVGRAADLLCPPGGRSADAEVVRRVMTEGGTERYEADRICKNGTVVTVSLTVAPIVNLAGAVVGVTTDSWKPSTLRRGVKKIEAQIDGERQVARDAQERFEEKVDTERRDAQDRFEEKVDGERRDARDAQERFEEKVDTERRDARDAQERFEALRDGERLAALERNQGLLAQLQQAQRMENLGQLAGGVAHDFNNLLAVILNYVSFVSEELAEATDADWAQRYAAASSDLAQVKRAGEQAASLTRQLLAFARREVIQPQVLDLDSVITAVQEMLGRTLGEHIELVIALAGDLRPVLADPGQLEQVLVNLALNARDAMAAGGTLTIDTGNITVDSDSVAGGSKSRQGQNVRLRVSDTGAGMTREVIEHAFEPFYTTKVDGTGTGLGLATVYGIVTQADGHVQIYSEPGTGTTFTITLPVTSESPTALAEPPSYERKPRGETVLVVEDEPALREVTKRIFARNGYQVITAGNGPEALEVARDYPGEIHLLVTDVVMPHMLGKEVAEKMLEIKPDIEVLFMSGYARPVLASQGRLEPHVALVEKPFSESDLITKAAQVLNGHFHGFKTERESP